MSYLLVSVEGSKGVYTSARPYVKDFGLTPNDASNMNIVVDVTSIAGGTATVILEESYDDGTSWSDVPLESDTISASGIFITTQNITRLLSPLVRLRIVPGVGVTLTINDVRRTRIAGGAVAAKFGVTVNPPDDSPTETTQLAVLAKLTEIEVDTTAIATRQAVVDYGAATTAQRVAAMMGVNGAAVAAGNPVHVTPGTGAQFNVNVLTALATEATLAALNTKVTGCDTSQVTIIASALPTGAATEVTLAALNTKVTACNTGAVVVAGSALPTGAATEATLDLVADIAITLATEATLAALNAKVTAVNTGAVVIASSALPTGAATSAKQDTGNTSLSSIDGKTPALVSGRVPVDGSGVTQPVSAAALPLPTGAATELTLTSIATLEAAILDTALSTLDDRLEQINNNLLAITGRTVFATSIINLGSSPITTGAWTQLVTGAANTAGVKAITVSNNTPATLELGLGGAGSEARYMIIPAGGIDGIVQVTIVAGQRISIRAVDQNASVNYFAMNFFA